MSAHTPGPWQLIGKRGTAIWADNEIIASVEGARAFHSIARANAELIAAAPDLLAALRGVLRFCHPTTSHDTEDYNRARAAIAKATGGA